MHAASAVPASRLVAHRNAASAVPASRPVPHRTPAPFIRGRTAFLLQASITVSFLAGSAAPTPLYPVYQALWGFSSSAVTWIFGIYALAVLVALLTLGRLSDHVGRRPVLIAATLVQAMTMLLFASATSFGELIFARIVQGVSAGAALAAVGAGLLDLDKVRGATANAITPPIGTGLGAILSGLLVRYLPAPTHTVYLLMAAVFVVQVVGLLAMAEPGTPRPGALASLRPRLALPASSRGPMLLAIPALVATWALAGFYASLGPSLVRAISGSHSALLGGLALFILAAGGTVGVLLAQSRTSRQLVAAGAPLLAVGVGLALASIAYRSLPAFFVASAIAGLGFGATFQGAIRAIATSAAPAERAGVLAIAFIVAYVSMGVPAIGAGYLVTHRGDIFTAAIEFGVGVIVLAAAAFAGSFVKPR